MKVILTIIGVLLVLFGGIWILQGINVLPGSFMTGQIRWAIYGGIAVLVGIILIVLAQQEESQPSGRALKRRLFKLVLGAVLPRPGNGSHSGPVQGWVRPPPSGFGLCFGPMKAVEEPVHDRGRHDPDDDQEDDAGVQRVDRGEYLAGGGLKGVDGTHAAQDHRSVQERIDPGQLVQKMIAGDAQAQRSADDPQANEDVVDLAAQEPPEGKQRLVLVFVHAEAILT